MPWLVVALVLLALPASAQYGPFRLVNASGSFGACTNGTDCFCDTIAAAIAPTNVIYCEDFDDETWDDTTGETAGAAGFMDLVGICPGGGTYADEGTDPADCVNFVQNDTCDVAGETDCAKGNQSLGQKFDEGYTHGIHANPGFTGVQNFGITTLVKYSANFTTVGTQGFKGDEFFVTRRGGQDTPTGIHWGQDVSSFWDCQANKEFDAANGGSLLSGTGPGDHNWETKLFTTDGHPTTPFGDCGSDASWSSAAITLGKMCCTNAEVIHWAPYTASFEGGTFDWADGTWGCLRTKVTGFGTSSMAVQQWWQDESDAAESLVISFSGVNTADSYFTHLDQWAYNNYFNGGDGFGSGYCTSATPPHSGLGCSRAYRYEDNIIITDGDPVSCAQVGLGS